jgi:hypothetical protein
MCLRFRGGFTDLLFVARLVDRAAAWVALVKQLRKEVVLSVFVEDQFCFGRRGVGFRLADFKESGSRTIRAADVLAQSEMER